MAFFFEEKKDVNYKYDYAKICADLNEAQQRGNELRALEIIRRFSLEDLFFLLYFTLHMPIINNKFAVERINDVTKFNHRTLDLWSREHFKSTIITFGLPMQEILRNPEERIGIFSHTRTIAKSFLRKIKETFEANGLLKVCFKDIVWDNPQRQAPKWSEDDGIIIKRRGKFFESSFEAWGLVDSQPTGKHFTIRVYDDIITADSVYTPDQISRTREAFQMSHNLGSYGGKMRIAGTRYHYADLFDDLIKSGEWKVREWPAIIKGQGVYWDQETIEEKKRDMGSWVWNSQCMLRPIPDENRSFQMAWLKYYSVMPPINTLVIIVDPANTKTKRSDYTVMVVIAIDNLRNYYLVDMVRDKLNLTERWERLSELVVKWNCRHVGYEKYGRESDLEFIRQMMAEKSVFFDDPVELRGNIPKTNRIEQLQPVFERGRFFLPHTLLYKDVTGKTRNLVHEFIADEYLKYPFTEHDDMLDACSRIMDPDLGVIYPYMAPEKPNKPMWNPLKSHQEPKSWMAT